MDERKNVEKALMELDFIDEPDLDVCLTDDCKLLHKECKGLM